jgi:hypothetical protein
MTATKSLATHMADIFEAEVKGLAKHERTPEKLRSLALDVIYSTIRYTKDGHADD